MARFKFKLQLAQRIQRAGKEVIYGRVLSNFEIFGPDLNKLLFERCKYLAMKPKKKKKKKDFGHFVLALPDGKLTRPDFEKFMKKKKIKKIDKNLLNYLENMFSTRKGQKVDCDKMKSAYQTLYPDAKLPPPPKKKKKKRKRKGKKKKGGKGVKGKEIKGLKGKDGKDKKGKGGKDKKGKEKVEVEKETPTSETPQEPSIPEGGYERKVTLEDIFSGAVPSVAEILKRASTPDNVVPEGKQSSTGILQKKPTLEFAPGSTTQMQRKSTLDNIIAQTQRSVVEFMKRKSTLRFGDAKSKSTIRFADNTVEDEPQENPPKEEQDESEAPAGEEEGNTETV